MRRRTRLLVEALDTQEHLKNEVREAGEHLERLERIGVIGQLSTIFAYEMRQPPGAILLYSLGLGKIAQNAEHVGNAENVGSVPATKILDVLDKLDRQTARADAIGTRVRSYAKRRDASRQRVALKDVVRSADHSGRLTFERGGTGSLSARVAIPVAKSSAPTNLSDPSEVG